MSLLYKLKHFFDRCCLKRKVKILGQNSYIKRKYSINNGQYVSIGEKVYIGTGAVINCISQYNKKGYSPKVSIGDHVYSNRFLTILCASGVSIGDHTYMGSFVSLIDENHGINPELGVYGLQDLSTEPISIGKNCWIGDKSTVLSGVSIGDYSIVGAGSVVTKSIPPFSIACGNPAKVIKRWNEEKKVWEAVK